MNQWTRIPWMNTSRWFDIRLRNHRIILAIATLAGLLSLVKGEVEGGGGILDAVSRSAMVGLATFLAWVVGREIDPDFPNSAHLAGLLSMAASLALGPPGLLLTFAAILLARTVNRSTGLPANTLDSIIVLGLSLLGAVALHPVVLGLGAVTFLLDSRLQPRQPRQIAAAFICLAAGAAVWSLGGQGFLSPPALEIAAAAALGTTAYVLVALSQDETKSEGDYNGERLIHSRVRAAQMLLAGVVVSVILTVGEEGVSASMPILAAMVGMAGYHLAQRGAKRWG
jgi:hypothetical protein